MKTQMMELYEWLESFKRITTSMEISDIQRSIVNDFQPKEKQDIINAHQCGVLDGYKLAVDGDESSEVDSADYFTQKYKQQ